MISPELDNKVDEIFAPDGKGYSDGFEIDAYRITEEDLPF